LSYRVIVKPSAERDIGRLPKPVQARVVERLAQIERDPRWPGSTKLVGTKQTYRTRVGDWRIIFQIDDTARVVFVTTVAHRGDVYRAL
jgi:mRNA interferase RelE/StbE